MNENKIRRLVRELRHETNPFRQQECFQALSEAIDEEGIAQVPFNLQHPPARGGFLQPMIAPNKWMVLQGGRQTIGADSEGTPIRMEFTGGEGFIVGFRATAINRVAGIGDASKFTQANAGVRMFINEGEELITNGVAEDFIALSDLIAPDVQWTPLLRYVEQTDVLTVIFRNFNPAGGDDLEVGGAFGFWKTPSIR